MTRVNLTNPWPGSSNWDNPIEKNKINYEIQPPINLMLKDAIKIKKNWLKKGHKKTTRISLD
jgi:ribosomal protein L11